MEVATVGTFFSLDTASSALSAAQIGQDVSGNNIANASTPGYSLESLILTEDNPSASPDSILSGQASELGSGVSASSIVRSSDQFLNVQVRNSFSSQSSLTTQSNWMDNIETAFNEPGNTTINTQLQTFFDNFANVENNPADNGVRITAIEGGATLASMIQGTQSQLTSAGSQIAQSMTNDMTTVNSDAQQIASLNGQIVSAVAQNLQPNTLLDQRDQLLDGLSKLTNISVTNNADGSVNVAIGSSDLVVGTDSSAVGLSTLQSRGDLTNGELSGLSQAQSNLSTYQTQLNNLASTVISQVNALHEKGTGLDGSTGLPFFTGTNASDIGVNQILVDDPQKLAVAGPTNPPGTAPPPGDSTTATAIANLGQETLGASAGALSGQTFQGYYNGLVTLLGSQDADAKANLSTASAAAIQLGNQRDQETGVNQDDELTTMMKYQSMYQAATKVITTEDTMLETLVTMLPAQ